MLVFGRFTLLAWVYVTYMLARGGFYTSTCTRASHWCGHPLRISLDRVPSTIYAFCILHNKALDFKEVHASRSKLKPDVAKKASTWDLIKDEFQKTTSLGIPGRGQVEKVDLLRYFWKIDLEKIYFFYFFDLYFCFLKAFFGLK